MDNIDDLSGLETTSPPGTGSASRPVTGGARQSTDSGWWATALVSVSVVVGVGIDVTADLAQGVAVGHVLVEVLTALVAVAGLAVAVWRLVTARNLARRAAVEARAAEARAAAEAQAARGLLRDRESELERVRLEAVRYRQDARDGAAAVARAVREQMARWSLTAAEVDVARMLLLGLAMKEIAAARDTSERTVREQAQSVYRKAHVAGRAELSAFFLEDLLPTGEA